jgi:predicted nucleic acid-binding protein
LAVILDTNGLAAMADGDLKLAPLIQQAPELAVPVIVLGEYQYGIRLSRHRTQYESWLNGLLLTCRLLVVDERTACLYADIRHELKRSGHPIPENDIWIAALARQHNSPLVTRDQHFDFVPALTRLTW